MEVLGKYLEVLGKCLYIKHKSCLEVLGKLHGGFG